MQGLNVLKPFIQASVLEFKKLKQITSCVFLKVSIMIAMPLFLKPLFKNRYFVSISFFFLSDSSLS